MGTLGNFFWVTYVILPFVNLKLVGTWAPTAKMIGDIPDFNVLNVPKTQPPHNPALWMRCFNVSLNETYDVSGLTHCGLVTPFGDIDLGQHWLK